MFLYFPFMQQFYPRNNGGRKTSPKTSSEAFDKCFHIPPGQQQIKSKGLATKMVSNPGQFLMLGRQITERLCLLFHGHLVTRKFLPRSQAFLAKGRFSRAGYSSSHCAQSKCRKIGAHLTTPHFLPHHPHYTTPHLISPPHNSPHRTTPLGEGSLNAEVSTWKSEFSSPQASCGVSRKEES